MTSSAASSFVDSTFDNISAFYANFVYLLYIFTCGTLQMQKQTQL